MRGLTVATGIASRVASLQGTRFGAGILAGLAIDFIGFPTGAVVGEVDPEIIFQLGLLDGPVVGVPALIAVYFYGSYRIGKVRHEEIRVALVARRAAAESS